MSDLYPHQVLALRKLSNGKILFGGVGSGKTHVAAHYYKLHEAPKDVIVITTAKKRDSFDWQNTFYELNVGPKTGPVQVPQRSRRSVSQPNVSAGRASREAEETVLLGADHSTRSVQDGVLLPSAGTRSGPTAGGSRSLLPEGNHGSPTGVHVRGESASEWLSEGARGISEREYGSGGASQPSVEVGSANGTGAVCSGDPESCSTDVVDHSNSSREVSPDVGSRTTLLGRQSDGRPGLVSESSGADHLRGGSGAITDGQGLGEGAGSGSGTLGSESESRNGPITPSGFGDDGGVAQRQPLWTLTVDSWNNINKYAGTEGAFFIFDEQRLVGSGEWTKTFLRLARRNNWILLSGTPGDTWMDYVPVFVANNFYKNRTAFKREHVVYNTFTKFPKVDRYINVGRLARQRAQLLVEMPYVRHTRRRHVEVPLTYDKVALDLVLTKRWHVFEDRPLRDVGEMCSVARKVVNSDPSRLEMVKELWQTHPKLIVFYNFNYELEALRSLRDYCSPPIQGTTRLTTSSGSEPISTAASSNMSLTTRPSKPSMSPIPISLASGSNGAVPHAVGLGANETSGQTSQRTGCRVGSVTGTKDGSPHQSEKRSSTILKERSTLGSTRPTKTGPKNSGIKSSTVTEKVDRSGSELSVGIAEWNGHKHEAVPTTDRWLYLVQYTAGAEAWECIETDATVFYSRNYSWKVWEQAQGRIDRLNTLFKDLWYYNFTTDSWIDRAIERSLKAKGTFNESAFARLFKG